MLLNYPINGQILERVTLEHCTQVISYDIHLLIIIICFENTIRKEKEKDKDKER